MGSYWYPENIRERVRRLTSISLILALFAVGCVDEQGGSTTSLDTTTPTSANTTTTSQPISTTTSSSTVEGELGTALALPPSELLITSAGIVFTPEPLNIEELDGGSSEGFLQKYLQPGVVGGGPTDAGATTYEEVSQLTINDLETFWTSHWPGQYSTIAYRAPTSFTWYNSATDSYPETACLGPDDNPAQLANNAFYCSGDEKIAYDMVMAQDHYIETGDFAIVAVIAHEWGHHLQHLIRGQLGAADRPTFSIEKELQADCFAGVYTSGAGISGGFPVSDADRQEAATSFYLIGAEAELGWFEPNYHGTQQERLAAFQYGFDQGEARACDFYATYMMDQTVITGPYVVGYPDDANVDNISATQFRVQGGAYGEFTLEGGSFSLGPLEPTGEAVVDRFLEVLRMWGPDSQQLNGVGLAPVNQVDNLTQSTQSTGIPGVSLGFSYQQQLGSGTVHGYVLVHLLGSGDALVLDVYRPGAAPTVDSEWQPVAINALRAISSFQAPGAID